MYSQTDDITVTIQILWLSSPRPQPGGTKTFLAHFQDIEFSQNYLLTALNSLLSFLQQLDLYSDVKLLEDSKATRIITNEILLKRTNKYTFLYKCIEENNKCITYHFRVVQIPHTPHELFLIEHSPHIPLKIRWTMLRSKMDGRLLFHVLVCYY